MGNSQERSLYHAARNGDEEAILEAIKQGADVNIDTKTPHNPHGWSPLHVAVNYNRAGACKLLLKRKADLSAQDKQGSTPLELAKTRSSHKLVELLEKSATDGPDSLGPVSPTIVTALSPKGPRPAFTQPEDLSIETVSAKLADILGSPTGQYQRPDMLLEHQLSDAHARKDAAEAEAERLAQWEEEMTIKAQQDGLNEAGMEDQDPTSDRTAPASHRSAGMTQEQALEDDAALDGEMDSEQIADGGEEEDEDYELDDDWASKADADPPANEADPSANEADPEVDEADPAGEEAAAAAEEAAPVEEAAPAAYLLADASLNCEHDMAQQMPASVDDFCTVLATGERAPWSGAQAELACTAGQKELLGGLIPKFNSAKTPAERLGLIGEFLVAAAKVEGLEDYKMILRAGGAGAYFKEDFPTGADEHGQTLAVGVLRWCRFEAQEPDGRLQSKLMDLKADRYETKAERDAALAAKQAEEDAEEVEAAEEGAAEEEGAATEEEGAAAEQAAESAETEAAEATAAQDEEAAAAEEEVAPTEEEVAAPEEAAAAEEEEAAAAEEEATEEGAPAET